MKQLLLSVGLFLSLGTTAQTTLYQENFNSGNTFNLNSSDLGASTVYNTWLVNNTYAGGSGTFVCMGFPFSFTIPNTPSQPVGITGNPSSNYMHISAQAAISSGITCASYIPSDGTCVTDESNFTKMTTPISTVGYTSVTIDFWWMCAGSSTAYGELYYSLDGGSTWILKQSNFNNVTNWTQVAITDAAWDNVASLMFAYRFVNTTAATAADPSLSIDEIVVTGVSASNSITTDLVSTTGWCEGNTANLTVDFTATGSYNAGNVFSAEISDNAGAFTAPIVIGTLSSTTSGAQAISATVPGTLSSGTGYRVRVVASDPVTTGTDNGSDLSVYALPSVSQSALLDVCVNGGAVNLVSGSPSGGTYSGTGVSGGMFDPLVAGLGTHSIDYTITSANGCSNTATETITVLSAPTVTFAALNDVCTADAAFALTGGSPAGGTYSGTGITGGVFDPSVAGVGTHTITYSYTDGNGCDGTATQTITVDNCASLLSLEESSLVIYPNPVKESFTIKSDDKLQEVSLIDAAGRVIKKYAPSATYSIDGVAPGVYSLVIKLENNSVRSSLIIE